MNVGKLGFGCMRLPLTDQEDRASFDEKQVEQMVDMFIEKDRKSTRLNSSHGS